MKPMPLDHKHPKTGRPKVVTLCGSTKFKQDFIRLNYELTKGGFIVLTVGWFSHDADTVTPTRQEKLRLDRLHKDKIELSDLVLVVDRNNYIGDSTNAEIDHALNHGVPVLYASISAGLLPITPFVSDPEV